MLIGEKSFWIPFVLYQIVHKVLANPFLGRQRDIAVAEEIENLTLSILLAQFYFVGR